MAWPLWPTANELWKPGYRRTAEYHIIRRRTEVQASSTWEPPGGTLGRILEETKRRLPSLEAGQIRVTPEKERPSLRLALRRNNVAIIAELKRRSPSKGVLNSALNAGQSLLFERGGASAFSVLTEPAFVGGTSDDRIAVRSTVS